MGSVRHPMVAAGKFALLFPGQGSQSPGMGKALYDQFAEARRIFDEAESVIPGIRETIFSGTEEQLRQTSVTQPAIYITSCAAFECLASRIPQMRTAPAFAAGHSLGEYSALYSAQVFDFKTGLKLVEYRGQKLEQACRKNPGGMAAVLGIQREPLRSLIAECVSAGEVCEMVNFNSPGQIVVAGSKSAVDRLSAKVAGVPGGKAIVLNVSGAFHSSLMNEPAGEMKKALDSAAVMNAKFPVITNCDSLPTVSGAEIKEKLVRQIDHPVLWEETILKMTAQGVENFVEVGPGKVLTGLMRKIDRKKNAFNIEDPASLEKAVQQIETAEVKTA